MAALALLAPACGGNGGGGDDDDDTTPDADVDQPDAVPGEWTPLIGRTWEIPAGQEIYRCIRIQVQEDMYINAFHTPVPVGEHHTVLTVTDNLGFPGGTELGEYNCDASNLDLQMLYASGVGSDDLVFPDGVAMKIEAGQYLNLNLHLFNTNANDPISGMSQIYVKTIPAAEVTAEAEMVFAGDMQLSIPPTNGTPHQEGGGCTFSRDATLLAYWPHMHQYAVHQKVTLTIDGNEQVLHDEPYNFEEQNNYPLTPPIQVGSGDSIRVDCFYENTTNQTIQFGDSSEKEMCFTGIYRYPKQAVHLFECSEGAGF